MRSSISKYFEVIDSRSDDSKDAVLELGLLLELFILPNSDRQATTRVSIGDDAVDERLTLREFESVLAQCMSRIKDVQNVSPHVLDVLASCYDDRIIDPLLDAIPLLVNKGEMQAPIQNAINTISVLTRDGRFHRG